jgi:hypothetical protein
MPPSHRKCLAVIGAIIVAGTACSNTRQEAACGKPAVDLSITFKDDGQGGCVGTVDHDSIMGQRKEWIYWGLQGDACSGFTVDKVKITFADNFVETKEGHVVNGTQTIAAKISKNPTNAPNGKHGYTISYGDKQSGDPDVDVMGDCTTCTPL